MSDAHASSGEHTPHVLPVRTYVLVGASLLFLTWLTVRVSYMDFGVFNLLVGVGIATVKAALVVMFFMHLKYDEPFNKVVFMGCLAFLAVFFVLTLADTMERGKVDPLEAHEIVPVPARPELAEPGGGHGTEGHAAPAAGEAGDASAGEAGAAQPGDGAPAHEAEGAGAQDAAPASPPGDAGGH
jgi:cytochrome c oxidase subunit 4